ncbi:hypothetical protein QBC32DRAFT_96051 [Pseudoneurospora amorphoporcata]|uniref:DUF1748-domain-containing protein n=1 Tax=Pseudoneurospora amorphoporcata TaxID=241081 RepID=A0AAN6NJW3_9PEZI|nr:hypothetical protein QBC32DRAFT_96051 [Pseudoneurospora amorphoporcata]
MVVGTPKFLASLALLFYILRPNVQRSPAPSPDFPISSLISIVLPSNSPAAAAAAAAASSLAVQRSSKNLFSQLLDLLTLGLWSKLGRLSHYAFDAVLLSAFLAGMKRSTGLTFKTDKVAGENKEVGKWVDKYLGVGEWVMDQSVAIAGSSGWFDRTR